MFYQIHFLNKDWNALTAALGKHAVRKEFGGDLPVEDVDGKLLAEFLKNFNPQFECKLQFSLLKGTNFNVS